MSDFPKRGLIPRGAIDLSRSVRGLLWREDSGLRKPPRGQGRSDRIE